MSEPTLFYPKLISCLKGYSFRHFMKDFQAGIVVGIVAIPLAIAFAIASGVKPEQGLITAIFAGFIISALGGSRVQIGGPTGAFVVILYGILGKYGFDGLTIATIMAGIMLVVMGSVRMGSLIKYIPTPLVVGFTSGIAVVIFSSQIRDFLGLSIDEVPAPFIEKWIAYFYHIRSINFWAVGIGGVTIAIILSIMRYFKQLPGAFIALIVTTLAVTLFNIPVDTIGSRFGEVSGFTVIPSFPSVTLEKVTHLLVPAFTIAFLAAIESLLSAVVADGMIGGRHRSNTELIAQGIANIVTPLFGGIAATGAIARTATNIRMGGRTPVAGIVHALFLLFIIFFAGHWVRWIPMPTLAGVLVVVAYNMSEWREFKRLLIAPKSDVSVLLVTFLLTVIFDLSIAIQIGMVLSAFLFMHRMATVSDIRRLRRSVEGSEVDSNAEYDDYYSRPDSLSNVVYPPNIEIFEAHGAFFYGASDKFERVLHEAADQADSIILRMNNVYTLDATGLSLLRRFVQEVQQRNVRFILTEVHKQCYVAMIQSRFIEVLGRDNYFRTLSEALDTIEESRSGYASSVDSASTTLS